MVYRSREQRAQRNRPLKAMSEKCLHGLGFMHYSTATMSTSAQMLKLNRSQSGYFRKAYSVKRPHIIIISVQRIKNMYGAGTTGGRQPELNIYTECRMHILVACAKATHNI